MATYYRWRQSEVNYTEQRTLSTSTIYISFPSSLVINYSYSNRVSATSNGIVLNSPTSDSVSKGQNKYPNAKYLKISNTVYYTTESGFGLFGATTSNLMISTTSGAGDIYLVTAKQNIGSFIEYVYSTNASAYPNGGVQGGYYYDQRTSFNQSSQLTVPSVAMQGQNITVNWTSLPIATSYTLQRQSSADSSWVQVYSGTALTFTEQVGDWTQVQYRVQTVYSGGTDSWVTSSYIPVSAPTTLVISGEDGDLGIITSNVPYTISSNSSDTISLTRKVNQVEVASLSINSGFAYDIPIFDLPTGTNTIELTATVQTATEGPVTDSRIWSYTKTPMQFVDTGGVAQLVQNGTNIWPITLSESVRVPTYLGGSLDKALQLLSQTSGFVVIAVGEYVGTGTYGQSNQNTLTFDSAPSMVLVYGDNETLVVSSPNTAGTAYIQGNQAKWYSTASAEDQMNSSGVTYNYIAVGKSS